MTILILIMIYNIYKDSRSLYFSMVRLNIFALFSAAIMDGTIFLIILGVLKGL